MSNATQMPFQTRMSQLVGSTTGLDAAIAMRRRVDALEQAAMCVIHWHEVSGLYEEARRRTIEEQQVRSVRPMVQRLPVSDLHALSPHLM